MARPIREPDPPAQFDGASHSAVLSAVRRRWAGPVMIMAAGLEATCRQIAARQRALMWLLALAAAGCSQESTDSSASHPLRAAVTRQDHAAARQIAAQLSPDDPEWAEGQMLLGEAAYRNGDAQTALRHFRAIPRDGSARSQSAARAAARAAESKGQLSTAIECYKYVLQHDPNDHAARAAIANLYAATGQRSKADQHLRELVKTPDFGFKQLVLLTDYDRRHPQEFDFLTKCAQDAPDDPAVNLGLAVDDLERSNMPQARRRLELAVARDPGLGAAQALVGEFLLDEGEAELRRWHSGLPISVQNDPEIWYVRGLWAQQRGEREAAARCFWECIRQVPHAQRAMYQLGVIMTELEPDVGRAFVDRAQTLYELKKRLSNMLNRRDGRDAALREIVALLLESGREWEAWSWAVFASDRMGNAPWIADVIGRLAEYPNSNAPRVLDPFDLARLHDLSHYPDFDEFLSRTAIPQTHSTRPSGPAQIRFLDDATRCGIEFVYHQGHVDGMVGVRMQESTGGGVGVLDYDCDGWPDLFLTQGEDWPHDADAPAPSEAYRDRLYRNRGDGFLDVTSACGLAFEDGFGQGCAAGDFNDDGFVDVYVANIGVNQLLLNNGDGTFTDATAAIGLTVSAWTSSCAIADINADGYCDLLDVNYVQGSSLYRMICNEHQCSPLAYESASDHLHLSSGEGKVRLLSLTGSSDVERGGAGLGVVAFRAGSYPGGGLTPRENDGAHEHPTYDAPIVPGLDSRRLAVFVANDQQPNFFFVNSPAENSGNLQLTDVAFVTGLAFNKDGRTTACMGVASGDWNGDRLLDLFVTNYKGEANNLYVQDQSGCFTDAIAGTGLLAPGVPYVGWGAQFLDADNDGRLDLVVANGHVANFREAGVEYEMPTQFFRNRGDATFEELTPEVVGPFFGQKMLGRSLATVDWNRDGRTDFILSSIGSPVALLTNQTEAAGNSLMIRLRATSTARDAIGAYVSVTTAAGEAVQQLTAGDGYQASNERVLRFGLGSQDRIEKVVVIWPGGRRQSFQDVPSNQRLDVVEGLSRGTLWDGDLPAPGGGPMPSK